MVALHASRLAACGLTAPSAPRWSSVSNYSVSKQRSTRRIENAEKRRQIELALEQARYEAALARRRYEAVDTNNRLVAAELERRWNERLLAARALEDERDTLAAAPQSSLSATERERLPALGADVERA
ncbi:exported hypothetical protein [Mesorhizobium sp. SOD10]|nr:exported hypothetical protein [Mesorhizobium sp. SOD10]